MACSRADFTFTFMRYKTNTFIDSCGTWNQLVMNYFILSPVYFSGWLTPEGGGSVMLRNVGNHFTSNISKQSHTRPILISLFTATCFGCVCESSSGLWIETLIKEKLCNCCKKEIYFTVKIQYKCVTSCVCVCIYIYIYRERERVREEIVGYRFVFQSFWHVRMIF